MKYRTVVALLLATSFSAASQLGQAKTPELPSEVLASLAPHEAQYCSECQFPDCHQTFRKNLLWQDLIITPSQDKAVLVEIHNMGFCGSTGCPIYLFEFKANGKTVQILGKNGEIGSLSTVTPMAGVTRNHYELLKIWSDGKTRSIYRWKGSRYSEYRTVLSKESESASTDN
jgi:hypothetical protein